MRIKIKHIEGLSTTIDVDETATISWLSTNYCDGNQIAVGFPPRSLQGDAMIYEKLQEGDLVRVLNAKMESNDSVIEKKRDKMMKKKKRDAKKAAAKRALLEECADETKEEWIKDDVEVTPTKTEGMISYRL